MHSLALKRQNSFQDLINRDINTLLLRGFNFKTQGHQIDLRTIFLNSKIRV